VQPDGRANPNQTLATPENRAGLVALLRELTAAHAERFGSTDDLLVGLQLTHSGRFAKPHGNRLEPRIAYHHPLLDAKFGIDPADESLVWTDDDLERLIDAFVAAARVAADVGFRFVDIKACHGYLLHEFLSARTRPGRFGGDFCGRTRLLRTIVGRVRDEVPGLAVAVRLSVFDFVPFGQSRSGRGPTSWNSRASDRSVSDRSAPGESSLTPALSTDGRGGDDGTADVGRPMPFDDLLPYQHAFGASAANPLQIDLAEPLRLLWELRELGVAALNVSCGSPYYNPHIQRPAYFPPSDGYQPPEDPLVGVCRQIEVTRQCKAAVPDVPVVGSGYSYLQEFLPLAGQAVVRQGWVDFVGLGRMVLSYPELPADVLQRGQLARKRICRTFSDCTTGPRNGLVSGCYPLDPYYKALPEAETMRSLKQSAKASDA
jgi:2,4-dienoyl-CoA reductase-like NADH-dependent reductase (Old Yellow Enzyme family)